jgi:hypothetical protein
MIALWTMIAGAAGPPQVHDYRAPMGCTAEADAELAELMAADQADRTTGSAEVAKRDAERLARVLALVEAGKVCSPAAHYDAALVLQHSRSPDHHKSAHAFARFAADHGHPAARWLAAASWDRWHVSRGLPQFFGTQLVRNAPTEPWCLVSMDPASTFEARDAWGMRPMAEMYARVLKMNDRSDLPATEAVVTELGYICAPKAWE